MDLTFPYKHTKNPSTRGKTAMEHYLETEKNSYTIKHAIKISRQLSSVREKKGPMVGTYAPEMDV